MKRIMMALLIGSLLSVTISTPVFAHGWNGPHVPGGIFNPLWPVAAALSIPAAIVGTVVSATIPEPYVAPVPVAPPVYSAPPAYYAPRVYVAPRGYYAPRAYYPPVRYYRPYYGGW